MRDRRYRNELKSPAIDSLSDFFQKLNSEINALVVVEGPRDARALRSAGFDGEIFMLCHNENLNRLEYQATHFDKVILLLDSDREGKKLAKRVVIKIQGKAKVDLFYRRRLLPASGGKIRHVEELKNFAALMNDQLTQEFTTSTSSVMENGLPI